MIEAKSKASGEGVSRTRSVHDGNLKCRERLSSFSVCHESALLAQSDNNLFEAEVFSQPISEPAGLLPYIRRLAQQGAGFVFVWNKQVNVGKRARVDSLCWAGCQNRKCPAQRTMR